MSKWLGDANRLVRAVFSLAAKMEPCIIFIGEGGRGEDACLLCGWGGRVGVRGVHVGVSQAKWKGEERERGGEERRESSRARRSLASGIHLPLLLRLLPATLLAPDLAAARCRWGCPHADEVDAMLGKRGQSSEHEATLQVGRRGERAQAKVGGVCLC